MAAQKAEASSTSIEFILLDITEWDSIMKTVYLVAEED